MPSLKPNQRAIDAVRPIDKRRAIYTIDGEPGLRLDVSPKGVKTWRVVVPFGQGRKGRQQRTVTIGPAEAITVGRAADEARKAIADAKLRGPGDDTFGELFERWHAYCQDRKKDSSLAGDRGYFDRNIKPELGTKVADALTRINIIAALDAISHKSTPIQANRSQAVISAVFSWALDEGLVTSHPAMRIRKRGSEQPRAHDHSEQELRSIWQGVGELNRQHCIAIRLLMLLGLRRSEIVEAERAELDLERGLLSIRAERRKAWRKGKLPLPHVVPLSPLGLSLVKEALGAARDSTYVFPNRSLSQDTPMRATRVTSAFAELRRELGLPHSTVHDLRHAVKTNLSRLGVPRHISDRVQDHTGSGGVADDYDHHSYLDEKRRALTMWQERLLEIVEGRPPSGIRWATWKEPAREPTSASDQAPPT